MIYQDEEKAKKLLDESEAVLNSLSQNTKERKEKYEQINKEIEVLKSELRHIILIQDPEMIANFETLNTETEKVNIKNIIALEDQVYAFSSNTNSLYKINKSDKKIDLINTLSINIGQLKTGRESDDGTILFLDELNQVVQIDLSAENPAFNVLENLDYKDKNILDVCLYAQRLYLLDSQNNQIYRHQKALEGYTVSYSNWLKEKADFSKAVSMAIDGNIFILNSNGEILKYTQGNRQDFSLKNIDPALLSPIQIFTDSDTNYIYILDPQNKRIVVLTKTGKLSKQFYSEKFDNLNGFLIFEKDKKMYVLNGLKVYAIGL
jgi:hypothetical protein